MKIYRKRLAGESGIALEVVQPDGTIRAAKYRNLGITIARTQSLALRSDASVSEEWVIREAEDEGHAERARIVKRIDGVVETYAGRGSR